jgi:3-phosphoshikimate 1-carboxyvinyltransferase
MKLCARPGGPLRGHTVLPGDKSISHRAALFAALVEGQHVARGFVYAGDTLATLDAVERLGLTVNRHPERVELVNRGLRAPHGPIDCANAGTALRLLAGLLAAQPFDSTLDGSSQLRRRPMRRVTEPLRLMGADIADTDGHAPLVIRGKPLRGISYTLPVASAQVKSAVLLAGLNAEGATTVIQPGPARDHTERMLRAMGAGLILGGDAATLRPGAPLAALDLSVPGDISSAAFVIVAACLIADSVVHLEGVGLNPTRTGLLDVLRRMGADIQIEETGEETGEPVGELIVRASRLHGTLVQGDEVVRTIDEFPILAVAATQAEGVSEVHDAAELRVKEVDRIALLAAELRKLGAQIEERPDGFVIEGPARLKGAAVDGHGDHRLAMALAVAGLIAEGQTSIANADAIGDSFPGFARTFTQLGADLS